MSIESPNGRESRGVCKRCGSKRNFSNSTESVMWEQTNTLRNDANRAYYQELPPEAVAGVGLALHWLDATVPLVTFTADKSAELIDDLISKKIIFHGAAREVGRSCIEIKTEGERYLLDAGIKGGW